MKNSTLALLGLLLILFAIHISRGFNAIQKKRTAAADRPSAFDPITDPADLAAINYLSVQNVRVELDTGRWQILLPEGEKQNPKLRIGLREDTLFIVSDLPYPGRQAVVRLKAPRLKGLAVADQGRILCDNAKARFSADRLFLQVADGSLRLPVDASSVDLRLHARSFVQLQGKAGRLNIHGQAAETRLQAEELAADSVYVHARACGRGAYQIQVDDYLEADLRNSLVDVAYLGKPTVVKRENSRGRVVNRNRS